MNIRFYIFTLIMIAQLTAKGQQIQPLWLIEWSDTNNYMVLTGTFFGQDGVQMYVPFDSIIQAKVLEYETGGNDSLFYINDESVVFDLMSRSDTLTFRGLQGIDIQTQNNGTGGKFVDYVINFEELNAILTVDSSDWVAIWDNSDGSEDRTPVRELFYDHGYRDSLIQDSIIIYLKGVSAASSVEIGRDTIRLANNPAINVTHAQLIDKIESNGLINGAFYRITDYQTKYVIDGTGLINTNVQDGNPLGEMTGSENEPPPIEPLIVIASSDTTINYLAFSALHPNDIIYYNPFDTTVLAETRPGYIYFRKDARLNVSTYYDFRNVKFRRWRINLNKSSNRTVTVSAGIEDTDTINYNNYYSWQSTALNIGFGDVLTPDSAGAYKDLTTFNFSNTILNTNLARKDYNVVFLSNVVDLNINRPLSGPGASSNYQNIKNATFSIGFFDASIGYVKNSIITGVDGFDWYRNEINFPFINTLVVGMQIFDCNTVQQVNGNNVYYNNTVGWENVTLDYKTGTGNRRAFIRGNIPPSTNVFYRRTTGGDSWGDISGLFRVDECYLNSGGSKGYYNEPVNSIGSTTSFVSLNTIEDTLTVYSAKNFSSENEFEVKGNGDIFFNSKTDTLNQVDEYSPIAFYYPDSLGEMRVAQLSELQGLIASFGETYITAYDADPDTLSVSASYDSITETQQGALQNFTHSAGVLTYTGVDTAYFQVVVNISLNTDAVGGETVGVEVRKNGTAVQKSFQEHEITASDATAIKNLPTSFIVQLAPNDYLQTFVLGNQAGAHNIIVFDYNMSANKL